MPTWPRQPRLPSVCTQHPTPHPCESASVPQISCAVSNLSASAHAVAAAGTGCVFHDPVPASPLWKALPPVPLYSAPLCPHSSLRTRLSAGSPPPPCATGRAERRSPWRQWHGSPYLQENHGVADGSDSVQFLPGLLHLCAPVLQVGLDAIGLAQGSLFLLLQEKHHVSLGLPHGSKEIPKLFLGHRLYLRHQHLAGGGAGGGKNPLARRPSFSKLNTQKRNPEKPANQGAISYGKSKPLFSFESWVPGNKKDSPGYKYLFANHSLSLSSIR